LDLGLSDVAFAARLATSGELRDGVQSWLEAKPSRPEHVSADDWLRFEQDKHEQLLAASQRSHELMETTR
jgi:hypothetical protein